jgi:hypothetical protein
LRTGDVGEVRVLDVTVREWPGQVSRERVAAAREGDRAALDAVVEA